MKNYLSYTEVIVMFRAEIESNNITEEERIKVVIGSFACYLDQKESTELFRVLGQAIQKLMKIDDLPELFEKLEL